MTYKTDRSLVIKKTILENEKRNRSQLVLNHKSYIPTAATSPLISKWFPLPPADDCQLLPAMNLPPAAIFFSFPALYTPHPFIHPAITVAPSYHCAPSPSILTPIPPPPAAHLANPATRQAVLFRALRTAHAKSSRDVPIKRNYKAQMLPTCESIKSSLYINVLFYFISFSLHSAF